MKVELLHANLTQDVLGCAIEVHRNLGPGLLENAYRVCLRDELASHGLACKHEVPIPIRYKDRVLETGYRADLIVNDRVIVELKAVDELLPIHEAQLLTYLRLSRIRVGLLMNFNVRMLKQGIRRFVH